MKQYAIRRLLQMIPTIIGVSVLLFIVFAMAPGNFIDSNPTISKERAAELKAIHGLDKPLVERYFTWAENTIKGDLGMSLQHKQPVTTVLNRYMWNSFLIAAIVLVLSWTIAILVGVFSAIRQHSIYDALITFLVFALMSLPSFFVGLYAIKLFAIDLQWTPVGGMYTSGSNATGLARIWDLLEHLALPVIVLTSLSVGGLTRYFRTSMLDVVRQDFIRTARAKGLKERTVIFKHALRNALLPAITLLGIELPGLFSGAMITEKIFNWPGIGRINLDAINARDYFLLMGFTMFLALLTMLGNLLADLLYRVADPRVRMK
ncbi:ABC transporter permease [Paenibacillus apiarius]|uniref:ABC transporter permease n=1 Tax=Paenibacillus apiarius TaxID=46240 RepID=A0ABT4DXG6_9BACL|nr:ABC transporter permease [Paenibacillus apiarius]MBN3525745.1 ABC transporter permease [Paenibacillus apiarius]MCY9512894.1 ABC transporter permease [Paenibacillus apiarius]MCY9522057.1 ABC transporter permease [Paenibacillus apiarius]MCY9554124.1 ABC transporter permease [Paenibacillus apiarius]MCY9558817.1 ABC transporter permease [Paenibacillus apiarius]